MDDAAARGYFPAATEACPTFVDDSTWEPLVDGESYLPALSAVLASASAGDSVTIVGLELDPALDLDGREPGTPGYAALGDRLARMAADGVDVRVLLAANLIGSHIPGTAFGGFRLTVLQAEKMRALRPDPSERPPLADRVLLDYSGAVLGSNHQKVVVAHIGGELTAFVGGIDLVTSRFDAGPHDRMRLDGERWGWHDIAVRVRGRAAEQVWTALRLRWIEAATLPPRHYLRDARHLALLNPVAAVPAPEEAPANSSVDVPGTAVRIVRSTNRRKIDSLVPWRRVPWRVQPEGGYREVFETLTHAIGQARRYVYFEDQYLCESPGGDRRYELFPALRAAAARGVKVVLVGSGTRDPEDAGIHLRPINREVNADIRNKIVDLLEPEQRANVAEYRIDMVTMHSKLVLVDDVFASIGSANIFSRSMIGTDCELCAAVVTTTTLVRDLRVAVWAEHLRVPAESVRPALEDLDVALGVWRPEWAASGDPLLWRTHGRPEGFAPTERVVHLVGP